MRLMFVLVALLVVADTTLQADSPRRSRQRRMTYVTPMNTTTQPMVLTEPSVTTVRQVEATTTDTTSTASTSTTTATTTKGSDDALAEVNAERAKRGLRPFLPDPLLNQAAQACAQQRAARHIHGHLPESDFRYVPSGGQANAAGCGALEPSWGWGTCCTYENYTYAGAAWVMGNDGRRYMHLFVR